MEKPTSGQRLRTGRACGKKFEYPVKGNPATASARQLNEQRGGFRATARTPLRSKTKGSRKIIKNLVRTHNHAKITHKLFHRPEILTMRL
jgi:hypothetical protein